MWQDIWKTIRNGTTKDIEAHICKWSAKDVQQWLKCHNLNHLAAKFTDIDGKVHYMLAALGVSP
jgi:hypothetical protein